MCGPGHCSTTTPLLSAETEREGLMAGTSQNLHLVHERVEASSQANTKVIFNSWGITGKRKGTFAAQ